MRQMETTRTFTGAQATVVAQDLGVDLPHSGEIQVTYVAVGPGCWGKGPSPEVARERAEHGRRRPRHRRPWDVFMCTEEASVDYLGRLICRGASRVAGEGDWCELVREVAN